MAGIGISRHRIFPPERLRPLGLAVLLAFGPTACSLAEPPTGQAMMNGESGKAVDIGSSFTGNYLAGRHAQSERDMGTAADFLGEALTQDPDNLSLLRRTFMVTTGEGRMDRAVELARKVVALDSDAMLATYAIITDDIAKGRFTEAETLIASQPTSGINAFMIPLLKAWVQTGEGRVDAALETMKPLKENEGFRPLRNLHAALILDQAGRMDEAGETFVATAREQDDPTLRLIMLIGNHFERAGKPDEAKRFYAQYQDRHALSRFLAPAMARLANGGKPAPDVATAADGAAEAFFGIASSLRQQNARELALVFGRMALHLRADFPMVQMLVAGILEEDERLEEANAIYLQIPKNSPFAWTAKLRLVSNLDALGLMDDAIDQLEIMAEMAPDDPDPLIDMGNILRGHERFGEAVTAYDKALQRIGTPTEAHWSILYARGIALERSGEWARAEADFLRALEFNPDQPYVLNYLGYSWIEKGMHLDRAQEMIKKAVELRPNDGYIVDSLGWVYYQLGNYEGAVKELERAVELRPDDPVINDHLGDAYWRVGRTKEARFQWRRSLGLDPEPKLRKTVEGKLRNGLDATVSDNGNG